MKKYIDEEKLIAEIERYKQGAAIARFDNAGENADYFQGKVDLCDDLTHIIDSLQQEMELPEKYQTPDWLFDKQEQQVLPGIEESGIPGKDFIPVEWVDACERYGKWKIVKQEQPDVDLEIEIAETLGDVWTETPEEVRNGMLKFVRYFWNKGYNARKEE